MIVTSSNTVLFPRVDKPMTEADGSLLKPNEIDLSGQILPKIKMTFPMEILMLLDIVDKNKRHKRECIRSYSQIPGILMTQ